jgi:hypothetical protein
MGVHGRRVAGKRWCGSTSGLRSMTGLDCSFEECLEECISLWFEPFLGYLVADIADGDGHSIECDIDVNGHIGHLLGVNVDGCVWCVAGLVLLHCSSLDALDWLVLVVFSAMIRNEARHAGVCGLTGDDCHVILFVRQVLHHVVLRVFFLPGLVPAAALLRNHLP